LRICTTVLDHQLMDAHLPAFSEPRFAPGTLVEEIDAAVADLPELVESFTRATIINTKTLIVLGSRSGAAH
jgi:hypothetical protein